MKRLLLATLAAFAVSAPIHIAVAEQTPDPLTLARPVTTAAEPTTAAESTTAAEPASTLEPATTRNGRDIFTAFLSGRADVGCDSGQSSRRWEQHFAHAPARLSSQSDDVLPLFGYVVDQLNQAGLPTEFALIPFVESGYRPGARSGKGPAGLWQFVTTTARNHHVPISSSYDGRLSAVDSTAAAVRYLKTLYGMFGGDWRLATMAYNAGESRILQAMRRAGLNASNARPSDLAGLSPITYSYVEKLHALACVLDHAQNNGSLLAALDRQVPILGKHELPSGTSLSTWAGQRALEPELLKWLNPALAGSAVRSASSKQILAPMLGSEPLPGNGLGAANFEQVAATAETTQTSATPAAAANSKRTHTVRTGDSAWSIARRYGITVKALLSSNGLNQSSVLKPGMVLAFDDRP